MDKVNNYMLWLYFFVVIQRMLKNSGVFCFLYFLTFCHYPQEKIYFFEYLLEGVVKGEKIKVINRDVFLPTPHLKDLTHLNIYTPYTLGNLY